LSPLVSIIAWRCMRSPFPAPTTCCARSLDRRGHRRAR
jgi:hypothetical protein